MKTKKSKKKQASERKLRDRKLIRKLNALRRRRFNSDDAFVLLPDVWGSDITMIEWCIWGPKYKRVNRLAKKNRNGKRPKETARDIMLYPVMRVSGKKTEPKDLCALSKALNMAAEK